MGPEEGRPAHQEAVMTHTRLGVAAAVALLLVCVERRTCAWKG